MLTATAMQSIASHPGIRLSSPGFRMIVERIMYAEAPVPHRLNPTVALITTRQPISPHDLQDAMTISCCFWNSPPVSFWSGLVSALQARIAAESRSYCKIFCNDRVNVREPLINSLIVIPAGPVPA